MATSGSSGVAISVSVRDLGLGAQLQSMQRLLANMAPVYKAVGATLECNVNLRFDTKTDPDGSAWAPWAKRTAAARKREGRGTLLEYTGRMRDSLTYLADAQGVEVGFGLAYAKYPEQRTPGVGGLPRRAMLFGRNGRLSDSDLLDAMGAAKRAFKKQLNLQGTP